jgi:hypothetical protein
VRVGVRIATAGGIRAVSAAIHLKACALKIIFVHIVLPFFAFSIVYYAKKRNLSQKVEKKKRLAPF